MSEVQPYYYFEDEGVAHRELAESFEGILGSFDEYIAENGGDSNRLNARFVSPDGNKYGYLKQQRNSANPEHGDPNSQRVFHYGENTIALFEQLLGDDSIEGLDDFLDLNESEFQRAQIIGRKFMQWFYDTHDADVIARTLWSDDHNDDSNVLRTVLFEGNANGRTIEPHTDFSLWTAALGESGPGLVIEDSRVNYQDDSVIFFPGSQLIKWAQASSEAEASAFDQPAARHYSVETEQRFSDDFVRYAVIAFFDPSRAWNLSHGGYKEAYGTDYNVK